MYVTRRLSQLIQSPNSLSDRPEGPNSGFLVIKDEESETYSCFGLCKNRELMDLPFPQNKELTIRYSTGAGENSSTSYDDVVFIPVLNHPLSSNRYYAIKPHGSHKGEAYTCSTDEDMTACCFCNCIKDIKPRPFNPQDLYQQYQICLHQTLCVAKGYFYANPVAPDSYPPYFLRRKGWGVSTKTPKNYQLNEATGLNASLRARLPEFEFPLSYQNSESIVIGKWYCPFVFIKDGTLKDQMKRSMYYEMTLEQRWEQIFARDNEYGNAGNEVAVDVAIQKEVARVNEREAVWDEKKVVDGVIWFTGYGNGGEEMSSVGLRLEIVGRMKWEEERGGWFGGEERVTKVKRVEEFGGSDKGGWREFGCYVLVERFVLKRMDGSIAMTYDFKHIHQLRSKWE